MKILMTELKGPTYHEAQRHVVRHLVIECVMPRGALDRRAPFVLSKPVELRG